LGEIQKTINRKITMKLTHLNTPLKRIDEIESLFINNKINSTKWRHLVVEHIDFLNEIVHIGLFVAAKDGKPLEVPNSQCEEEVQKSCASANGCECYLLELRYNVAQQEVIFEGWEVVQNKDNDIVISNKTYWIHFSHAGAWLFGFDITFGDLKNQGLGNVDLIKNLAEATQSNPLKLK
jgi:hypothetical protein